MLIWPILKILSKTLWIFFQGTYKIVFTIMMIVTTVTRKIIMIFYSNTKIHNDDKGSWHESYDINNHYSKYNSGNN